MNEVRKKVGIEAEDSQLIENASRESEISVEISNGIFDILIEGVVGRPQFNFAIVKIGTGNF